MSFSLRVYVREFDEHIDQAWAERMNSLGLRCVFPSGFSLLKTFEIREPIICTVSPPLSDAPWEPQATGINVDAEDPEDYDLADAEASREVNVRAVMRAAKQYFHFYSSAGRADIDLLMQCYGAAALADVGKGVIVDEDQQMAYGWGAYAIAHKNTQFVFKIPEPRRVEEKRTSFWRRMFG